MRSNKVLILWSFQTSFIEAGVRALLDLGFSVTIVYVELNAQYPEQNGLDSRAKRSFLKDGKLNDEIEQCDWDYVLVLGWAIDAYRQFCFRQKQAKRVMYMDNQFRGTLKQRFLSRVGGKVIPRLFDAAYVTGNRQQDYANMIGFSNMPVIQGGAPFDEKVYFSDNEKVERNGPFLFVGRLSKEKGLDLLIKSYKNYSNAVENPRNLIIIGPPENVNIPQVPGIQVLGYRNSQEIAKFSRSTKAFIFPSSFEQWGVSLVEAAACGNPVIASKEVGASDHLISETNGFVVHNQDEESLTKAMIEIDAWDANRLRIASSTSISLARKYASSEWATRLVDLFSDLDTTKEANQPKKSKKFMLYLTVVPEYRKEPFAILQSHFSDDLEIYCAPQSMDGELHSHREAKQLLRVWHINQKIFFLGGRFIEALRVESLIIDLNPRSLSSWLLLFTRKFSKKRTLVWGHIYPRSGPKSSLKKLRFFMMKISDGILAYTYEDLDLLQNSFPNLDSWVVPNSLYKSQDIGLINGRKRNHLLYVGRLTKDKKVDLLIDAFIASDLAESGHSLIICGDGEEKKNLILRFHEFVRQGSVQFIDQMFDSESISNLYSSALVSISPGYAGLSITQSLGFGVPIIVGRGELHAPEIALAGKSNLVISFTRDSVPDLVSELNKAIHFMEKNSDNCLKAAQYVRENYSAERMAKGFIAALKNIRDY